MDKALGAMKVDYISSPEIGFGSIRQDLGKIKDFAAGIVVPKGYIWPVNSNKYLEPATTLVADARKLGLEVYASGFANDAPCCNRKTVDHISQWSKWNVCWMH